MNRKAHDHHQVWHLPALIVPILVGAGMDAPVQAQHFYDHDRQWKNGSVSDNGTVPDDYLMTIPSAEVTLSSPPMGYRVTKQQLRMQQMQERAQMQGAFYMPSVGYSGRSARSASGKRDATAIGGKDDSQDWLNGMGGTQWGSFTVTADDRSRAKAGQTHKRRTAQSPAPVPAQTAMQPPAADSAGLIRGGSGTTYRMNGRGQF